MNILKKQYLKLKWKWLCRGFTETEKTIAELLSVSFNRWDIVKDELTEEIIENMMLFLADYDKIDRFNIHPMSAWGMMKKLRSHPEYTENIRTSINRVLSDYMEERLIQI